MYETAGGTVAEEVRRRIIRMLGSEFDAVAGDDTDFYPASLRAEIDRINELVYANVNNGVYRCAFARSIS